MPRHTNEITVYRIANLYYIQKMKQEEIAKTENISRSQVSRLLEKAQQLGIATVTVNLPQKLNQSDLADALARHLGIAQVIISPVNPELCTNSETARQVVAELASSCLPQLLKGCKKIGVGWGRTMYEMSLGLAKSYAKNKQVFLPLLGASGDSTAYLQINNIIDRISEKLGASGIFTSILTIRDSAVPLSQTEQNRVNNLQSMWKELDAAVFGIGTVPSIHSDIMSEFSSEYLATIQKSGAVGDILAQFFYANGNVFLHNDQYTITSFPLKELSSLQKSICVAGGAEKADVLIAAAQHKFYKTLLTDANTASVMFSKLCCERRK